MNIGTLITLGLAVLFGIIGVVFALLKEKGAILISGFNTMSKEKRAEYDKNQMSKDMRNSLFLWTAVFIVGTILSYFISQYFAVVAVLVWIILFFKDVHMDLDKAFEKYKVNKN